MTENKTTIQMWGGGGGEIKIKVLFYDTIKLLRITLISEIISIECGRANENN